MAPIITKAMNPRQHTPLQDWARGEILGRFEASLPATTLALCSSCAQIDDDMQCPLTGSNKIPEIVSVIVAPLKPMLWVKQ